MIQIPKTTVGLAELLRLTIKNNYVYFLCFCLFLVLGGLVLLNINQGDLLLFFSDNRSISGNFFFKYFTKVGEELTYLGFVLLFLWQGRRLAAVFVPVIGFLVTIISYWTKNFFLHPRPSEYYKQLNLLGEISLVDGVQLLKGLSSFPSGHTMSAFALFTFVALVLSRKGWLSFFCFFCAFAVGISRIYLVQHFLQDVYAGAIIGTFLALFIYLLYFYLKNKKDF